MKRFQIITGIFLLLFLAANAPLDAQRGMRGMRMDSLRIHRMDSMRMGRMGMRSDSVSARFLRPGMGPGRDGFGRRGMGPMWNGPMANRMYMWNSPMGRGMGPVWMGPMHRNMGPAWWGPAWWAPSGRGFDSANVNRMRHNGMGMGLGSFFPDSIPGITPKQKAALKDLREKNQGEMKKFREDMASKMQSMREEHRKGMMDLLTPEQKKWVESRYPGLKGK